MISELSISLKIELSLILRVCGAAVPEVCGVCDVGLVWNLMTSVHSVLAAWPQFLQQAGMLERTTSPCGSQLRHATLAARPPVQGFSMLPAVPEDLNLQTRPRPWEVTLV